MAVIHAVITEDALRYWSQALAGSYLANAARISDVDGSLISVTVPPPIPFKTITHFVIGEGGWIDGPLGRVPRVPDPALRRFVTPFDQTLDAIVDIDRPTAQRYLPVPPATSQIEDNQRFTYSKPFVLGDITRVGDGTIECKCYLDFADTGGTPSIPGTSVNNDGSTIASSSPEFYEIGIFTDHPTQSGSLMIAYGTFPRQIKTVGTALNNFVLISFSGT